MTHAQEKKRCRASLLLPLSRCCPPPQPRLLSSRTRSRSSQGGVESSRRPSTAATLTQVSVCLCLSCCQKHVIFCLAVDTCSSVVRCTPCSIAVSLPHGQMMRSYGHATVQLFIVLAMCEVRGFDVIPFGQCSQANRFSHACMISHCV
jgi:hypothetical protein